MSVDSMMPINQIYSLTTHKDDGGIDGYHL